MKIDQMLMVSFGILKMMINLNNIKFNYLTDLNLNQTDLNENECNLIFFKISKKMFPAFIFQVKTV